VQTDIDRNISLRPASRAIDPGEIHQPKGKIEKSVRHFELALVIASPFNWRRGLFWIHYKLARLFRNEARFDDAHAHIERAKSHTANTAYYLGCALELQAMVWYDSTDLKRRNLRFYVRPTFTTGLGATKEAERCRISFRVTEEELDAPAASGQSGFNCEFP
jgi:tetratricopeptide (TPR) repeat protein